MRDYTQLNGLALAYVGDAIYEIYVRDHLIDQGETKPNKLHRAATNYVSANAQAFLIQQMLEEHLLTEEEDFIIAEEEMLKAIRAQKMLMLRRIGSQQGSKRSWAICI